jgi:hypothetical protein
MQLSLRSLLQKAKVLSRVTYTSSSLTQVSQSRTGSSFWDDILDLVGPSFFLRGSFGTFCHDFQVVGINKYTLPGTSA